MRSGRPPTYTAEQRSAVIAAALTRPAESGPAVRIVDAGPPGGLLGREGHRHQAQPDERDPARRRAEVAPGRDLVRGAGGPGVRRKRGRSSGSTPPRPRAASSSASTRWGRSPPGAIPAGAWSSRPLPRRSGPSRRSTTAGAASGYVFGAFQPATGEALTAPYVGPHDRELGRFPGQGRGVDRPAVERVYAVIDNLNATARPMCCSSPGPPALGVRLPAQVRGLPEPDRAVVEDPALAGAQGPPLRDWAEIEEAVRRATAYWNEHRHPFLWGRRRRHRTARRPGVAAVPNIAITYRMHHLAPSDASSMTRKGLTGCCTIPV